jgi:hypothetical protein
MMNLTHKESLVVLLVLVMVELAATPPTFAQANKL